MFQIVNQFCVFILICLVFVLQTTSALKFITFISFTIISVSFSSNLFVIFLHSGKIFTSFTEFTFFHTLADIPVDERAFCVHKIELVVHSAHDFSNSGGVTDHKNRSLNLSKVASRNNGRWLVVNTDFEATRSPVDESDGSLGLDGSNSSVDILRDDVTSVHQAASHVFSVPWVAFDHLVGRLENGVGDFRDGKLFVICDFCGNNRSKAAQWEMNSWEWDQVRLEGGEVDVQSAIESEGSSDTRDALGE